MFFDWDKDTITPDGMRDHPAGGGCVPRRRHGQIQVTGYTDRSGSPGYNQRLSERRANNVANALGRLGVPRQADGRQRPRRERQPRTDRRRCARAAEPPRRDRLPVSTISPGCRGRGPRRLRTTAARSRGGFSLCARPRTAAASAFGTTGSRICRFCSQRRLRHVRFARAAAFPLQGARPDPRARRADGGAPARRLGRRGHQDRGAARPRAKGSAVRAMAPISRTCTATSAA